MKTLNFATKNNAQVAEMLKEAVRMVRESQAEGGHREHFRMGLVDEVTAECERRGINAAQVVLSM